MSAAALLVALALAAPAPTGLQVPPVRVLPRAELPWVVAVAAPTAPGEAEAERRALLDAGGRVSTLLVGGLLFVRAEGPPEAEPLVLAAVRAMARGAPVFLEGRVATPPSGALPPARAPPRPPLRATPPERGAAFSLPLPLAAWLLDDDGEVLRLAVARALAKRGAFEVALDVDTEGARLLVKTADKREAPAEEVRAALREAAEVPLPPRQLEALRAHAAADRARRGATLGSGALAAATRAWWFGGAGATPADDVSVRVRAAIIAEALTAVPPSTRAP